MGDGCGSHWDECWRQYSHHNCAVDEIERLTQRLAQAEDEMATLYVRDVVDAHVAHINDLIKRLEIWQVVGNSIMQAICGSTGPLSDSDVIGAFDELEFRLATSESLCDALQARLAAAEARVSELTTKLARRCSAETCDKEELLAAHIELRERLEDIQTINRTLTVKISEFEDRCENDRAKEVLG